jgi:hypothetical protein
MDGKEKLRKIINAFLYKNINDCYRIFVWKNEGYSYISQPDVVAVESWLDVGLSTTTGKTFIFLYSTVC